MAEHDLARARRAAVVAEMDGCVVDSDRPNWCFAHESRVQRNYDTCDRFDDAMGLAESVQEAIEPLIRTDERERLARAINMAAQIAREGGRDEGPGGM